MLSKTIMANKNTASDAPDLLQRVRDALPNLTLEEKRMFGGVTLLLNGNMLCCVTKEGGVMVRVGKEAEAAALKLPHTKPCDGAGHKMPGFILIAAEGVQQDKTLKAGVKLALDYVSALPAKAPKATARKPKIVTLNN